MSTKKTLKFNVRQDGTVTEEVLGNVGNACENLTAEIEKRLGAVTQRVHKAEYNLQEEENETLPHNKDFN